MKPEFFNELNKVNVNENKEHKNRYDYLSWTWAWTELKKRYPLSYSTVHETADGSLVHRDPRGAHVKTTVTLVWEDDNGMLCENAATEYLPIMSNSNQSVPYDQIDSMMVNKAIQRSITKCIARHGLGLYIYAGEDLPDEVEPQEEPKEEPKAKTEPKKTKKQPPEPPKEIQEALQFKIGIKTIQQIFYDGKVEAAYKMADDEGKAKINLVYEYVKKTNEDKGQN